jgi:hypothetical protein
VGFVEKISPDEKKSRKIEKKSPQMDLSDLLQVRRLLPSGRAGEGGVRGILFNHMWRIKAILIKKRGSKDNSI